MILYNGASGGLGKHLAEALSSRQAPAHALVSRLEDQSGLKMELGGIHPQGTVTFIHLAARVSVPACESDPAGAYRINVDLARSSAETILDWAEWAGASAKVVYVSTGHVYAAPPVGSKTSEDAATQPRSVYAKTKLAAEEALASLSADKGVPLLIARVFGLIGPRQAPSYVLPGLIARAAEGNLDEVPGLDNVRDYLDARDVCEDLLLLASAPSHLGTSIVNVCSGVPVSIRQLLEVVLECFNPDGAAELARCARSAPGRGDDISWLVGDPSRFERLTGISPQRIPLWRTVADASAHYRASASEGTSLSSRT